VSSPSEPVLNCVLPRIVKALRKRAELKRLQVAERLGCTPPNVNQLEQHGHPISEKGFVNYVRALGLADELEALAAGIALLRKAEKRRPTTSR
jgi:transcriptional regulator with XRE-family HTH domain